MNYKKYLISKHWKDTKKYFKLISKKRCYCCGSYKFLALHHRHYKTIGYEDGSELCWLCPKHHKEIHFNNGKFEVPDSDKDIERLSNRLESIRNTYYPSLPIKVKKEIDESQMELWRLSKKKLLEYQISMSIYFNEQKLKRFAITAK